MADVEVVATYKLANINTCIEIFKQGFERGKILYSCGNTWESRKIFYYVHFIEYAIFNTAQKG